jgi:tRNA (mo5U34)-methyltransferase
MQLDWQSLIDLKPQWAELIATLTPSRFAQHGDYGRWQQALDSLPELTARRYDFSSGVVVAGAASPAERSQLERALQGLHPWRKGPFELFGLKIATEWRSDWKWQRLAPHLDRVRGLEVLDVGCGNGYFGWRALGAGASRVVGVDPSLLFFMQHLAICRYLPDQPNWLLPITFESLPVADFDLVMSMGVVYHRKDPAAHVRELFAFTRPGGRIVLETLIVEADDNLAPAGRYARMRNVHVVPTPDQLRAWLEDAGCRDVAVVDINTTSLDEQRSTDWMRFESLAEALDPADPTKTVEGHPAPVRAIVIATRPA